MNMMNMREIAVITFWVLGNRDMDICCCFFFFFLFVRLVGIFLLVRIIMRLEEWSSNYVKENFFEFDYKT